jgi:hypothetical protein
LTQEDGLAIIAGSSFFTPKFGGIYMKDHFMSGLLIFTLTTQLVFVNLYLGEISSKLTTLIELKEKE